MNQRHRLLNPITGEIRLCHWSEARALRRYGWREVGLEVWFAYQRAVIELSLSKSQGNLVRH